MRAHTLGEFAAKHEAKLDGPAVFRIAGAVDDIATGDDREVTTMQAADTIRVLHGLVEMLLDSAHPHPTQHPTMWRAWSEAQAVSLKPSRALK